MHGKLRNLPWLIAGLLFLLLGDLYAQPMDSGSFRRFSVDEGLPSSTVYHILQDHSGYIWFATDHGVARYDGRDFRLFRLEDGLPVNDVWYLREDSQGRIWMYSHAERTGYYVPEEDAIKSIDLGLETYIYPYGTFEDEAGTIYFTEYRKGIITLDTAGNIQRFNLSRLEENRTLPFVQYLFDQGEEKWYFDNSGILIQHPDSTYYFEIPPFAYPSEAIRRKKTRHLVSISEDTLIYEALDSIYLVFPKTRQTEGYAFETILGADVKVDRIISNRLRGKKVLLFQTNQGLFTTDQKLNLLSEFSFLKPYTFVNLLEDHEGNIWVTNAENGAVMLPANAEAMSYLPPYDEEPTALGRVNGQLLIGTSRGNLHVWDDGQLTLLYSEEAQHKQSQFGRVFTSAERALATTNTNPVRVIRTGDNLFLFGIGKEMTIWENAKLLRPKSQSNRLFGSYYIHGSKFEEVVSGNSTSFTLDGEYNRLYLGWKDLAFENDTSLYIASSFALFHLEYHPEAKSRINMAVSGRVFTLTVDYKGRIWYSQTGGMGVIEKGTATFLGDNPTFPLLSANIRSLKVDAHNTLWVGTDGHGLFGYQHDAQRFLRVIEMENAIVKKVHIDDRNRVWATTNEGVHFIQVHSTDPFSYTYSNFSNQDGLPSNEINSLNVVGDSAFIATRKGLVCMDLNKVNQRSTSPPILISSLSVAGQHLRLKPAYTFSYDQKNLAVGFTGISFGNREDLTYHYELTGQDTLTGVTTSREAVFPNLAPGSYQFSVHAISGEGLKSTEPATFHFTISPPWWNSWGFRIPVVVVPFLLLIGFIAWRIRKIRLKEAELTQVNKKFAELELQALQAQMNPHFVFNALNSIQKFIIEHDTLKANEYLAHFAKLMRLFLESSYHKTIPLIEEISLLKLYIELEKLRFPDKFESLVLIDPELQPELIEIPSLLLQPFVENAINHGLIHKSEKGLLKISMVVIGSHLICLVEDNGIGRKAAAAQKEKSLKSYRSRGTKIVEERIKAINLVDDAGIQINTRDLLNEAGDPAGTRIEIKIPYEV